MLIVLFVCWWCFIMADLAEQLKNVKLKKSLQPIKDFSCPKTAGFIKQEDIDQYQSQVLDVNTEQWLHLLKGVTFPTEFTPISVEEAKLFVKIYERLYANLDPPSISKIDWRKKLCVEESEVIKKMNDTLQKSMNTYIESDGDYVFVKLSSRSPKDAPMTQSHFKELYKQFILQEASEQRHVENVQLTCLLKAAFEAMKTVKASEVIDSCLRSERIYQDLLLALANPERFRENWVIRKFVHIDVDMEFRAFVHSRKLTAVSQYNYCIFSKRLIEKKDYYLSMIKNFFNNEVKPKLEQFIPDYIIDFAVCENGTTDIKIWVIEINPFLSTTDSALFSWEHERHLLEHGDSHTLFRTTEKPRPGARSMLPNGIKDLIKECSAEISSFE